MNNMTQYIKEEAYWLNKLSGDWRKSNFPYDREPDKTANAMNENIERSPEFRLAGEMFSMLMKLSGNSFLRLHMILTAGVVSLLSRYTSNKDIIVGASIYKQKIQAEFINTVLILRNRFTDTTTFKELLLQVRSTITEAVENQNYPVEMLLQKLGIPFYKGNDFPLFDVLVLLENIQDKSYIRRIKRNMLFLFSSTGEEVKGIVEYNASLYNKETIGQVIIHLENLLQEALKNVDTPIGYIDILTEEEKKRLLYDVNQTEAKYPEDKTIHGLFVDQVEKTPDNIAAMASSSPIVQITYRDLNEKSDHLARWLKKEGVVSDTIVGIMMERSIEMITGIMGILKAGAAYLPIDPEYPQERINYILKDSGAKLLVTINNISSSAFSASSAVENLLPATGHWQPATSLAYVIYTSGSTGKPKGVAVEHRALVNYVWWAAKQYVKNEKINFPFYTSIAFDLTVTSLYTPLITGNTIFIYRGEDKRFLVEEIFDANKVEVIKATPAHLMLISNRVGNHLKIRRIIAGGEKLDTQLARRIHENFNGNIEIYNEYGPTEAAVGCMIYKFDRQKDDEASVPIGEPADNVQIYLLDEYGKLVPQGGRGEIHIVGDGLARGYLNKPELTAEKFVPNPFNPGEKMFKTGDMARRLADGNIEFLGRKDQQVKIRGFRIEPGEIENELLSHDDIKEATVVTREDKDGNIYLCAYIITSKTFTTPDLREYLSGRLPDYMIPSYFVPLERIPLTPNGKVDRRSLPEPQESALGSNRVYIAPRNLVERKLVDIWQMVLGRNTVGIEENFFEIGGDSIKTIQIISRMQKAGYKIEMRDIFQNPRISQLTPLVKKIDRIADQSVIKGTVPLAPVQKWFFENITVDNHHFNQEVMFYAREGFDEAAVKAVFTKLQEHHDALRITFGVENGEIVQTNHGLDYPFELKVYDYRNTGNAVKELENRANEIQASIDLGKGPLMKLGLFHLDDGDRLLIAVHHLVIDGVSWRILFDDIETLYNQYKQGKQLVLPSKTDSFKLWSEKLSAYADSKIFLKEKTYWQKIESAESPASSIPKDFDVADNYIKDTGSLSFTLREEETGRLLTKVNETFRTEINDILLTALGMGIKETFGHERVLIVLEGHGREQILEDIDISRTVGWFTTLYPVLMDVSYAGDRGRQIKEIKETLRRIPNKGIGYGILKYLSGEENKKEIEFKLKPQISFNYLGQFDADVKQFSSFEIARESAGNSQSPNSRREYLLDVSGITANNRLTMTTLYNKTYFKPETISALVDNLETELKNIIEFCCSREKVERTPGDFTYKELSIETIDRLLKEYPGIEDIYTLTPMQEGMLFHALVDEKSYSYFEQTSYRLQGELDIVVLEKSLNELFKRHDILRTAFVYKDIKRPVQVLLKDRLIDFYFQNISEIGEREEKENLIKEFKERDKRRSFDLSKDVLMRVSIFRADESEYEFIWSFHHILMDGWCLGILNNEFFEIYKSYLENRPYRLPGVKPYRTYIRWLEKQDKEEAARYWENYLVSFEECTGVPRTKILTKEESRTGYRNETVSMVFDMEKTAGLNKLAAGNHVTLNTVAQTLWGILLGKYNGKEDVVFGAVVSGRPSELEGVESMVGLFINTIPVRICFEEKMKFYRLLQKVQEEALASEPYH
ncbi:MAG: amino acid adenylation domain-containing protein, partial [Candidatus Aminicenantes bacterium]